MSFVLMKRFETCIKVITDSAAWDEEGNVRWLGSKIRRAANGQPLAVTCTGDLNSATVFHDCFDLTTAENDVDQSLDNLEYCITAAPRLADDILGGRSDRPLCVLAAGYSPARGFFLQQGCSEPLDDDNPAGQWRVSPAKVAWNLCATEDMMELDVTPFNVKLATFDNFVLPFVTWQRNQLVKRSGHDVSHSTVGGKIDVTTITTDGATTEVVHDFGDVIGNLIEVPE